MLFLRDALGKFNSTPGLGGGWTADIGNVKYRYRLLTPAPDGSQQLVISKILGPKTVDTANTITINNFKQDQAANGGYMGIRLDRTQKALLLETGTQNALTDPDFDPTTLSGKACTIGEGLGKSFTICLAGAAKAGDTITVAFEGAGDKFKVMVNGTTSAASGAVITLNEGQTEVAFALVQEGAVTADASGSLSVSYQGEYGSATSNSWGITAVRSNCVRRRAPRLWCSRSNFASSSGVCLPFSPGQILV